MKAIPEKNKMILAAEPGPVAYNHPVAIRLEQAEEFLLAHFGGGATKIELVGRGLWSRAFFFRRAGNDYVLRFGNEGESYEKDRIAAKYSSEKMLIPAVTETGTALGRHFAISERAAGTMIDELAQSEMEKIVTPIMEMLDALRRADVSATAGYGNWNKEEMGRYPSWRDFLFDVGSDDPTNKIHGWRASLESSPQGIGSFNQIANKLKELAKNCYEGRHLVHTDLLYFNVLAANGKIAAVIDWGNSIYGDFLYDLANFTFWASLQPSIQKIDWATEARQYFRGKGIEVDNFNDRLSACELHIGLAGMAWNAYSKNWKELQATTKRAKALAESF